MNSYSVDLVYFSAKVLSVKDSCSKKFAENRWEKVPSNTRWKILTYILFGSLVVSEENLRLWEANFLIKVIKEPGEKDEPWSSGTEKWDLNGAWVDKNVLTSLVMDMNCEERLRDK